MTCKDCIHEEMCANQNKMVQIDEHTWDEYEQTDNVEELCKHFKNKADFVEVVRCKDCAYRYTKYCNAKHERADMDYCSSGDEK